MKEHDIVMCQVPTNMTHLFQLLDLIEEGLKPLHASWVVDL